MNAQDARKHAYAKFAAYVPTLIQAIETDNAVKEMQAVDALILALESIKEAAEDDCCGMEN